MAFYYHFKDIYDLVEWSCLEDATQALQGKKRMRHGRKACSRFLRQCSRIKPFIMNVYHSVSRGADRNISLSSDASICCTVSYRKKQRNRHLREADQSFIADFYKYSFTGVMLDWIKRRNESGLPYDCGKNAPHDGRNVVNSIRNFDKI